MWMVMLLMRMDMFMTMRMLMFACCIFWAVFIMGMGMSVQIFHIMVVIFVLRIQPDIEVANVKPRLFYSAYFYLISMDRKAFKSLIKYLLICPCIQQGRNRHIPADSRITFQI